LLDILERDPNFRTFMLDGQTIVLDDYLLLRPERRADLRRYIQEGRITIGPWHILPDEFLVSPEATIRNLLQGERSARPFGPKMKIGYIPDPFGHIGQMPQILRGFGIETACVQRGLADEPCEFWWQAPDGSRVFMAYLRDGYSNAADLQAANPEPFRLEICRLRDALLPHTRAPHVLLMWGTDHMEPDPGTTAAIASAQGKLGGDVLVQSSLAAFIRAVQDALDLDRLAVVQGELRSPRRHPLLPNVLSTRMWIKQRNQACETLLEKWAEPFSTWAEWNRPDSLPPLHPDRVLREDAARPSYLRQPAPIMRQAWRMLMENHPHDSICGCSIDPVHEEMRSRFSQVEQVGERITGQSLELLAGVVKTTDGGRQAIAQHPVRTEGGSQALGDGLAIVVFNPLGQAHTDAVEVSLELPEGIEEFDLVDEDGTVLPFQNRGLGRRELINMTLSSPEFKRMVGMTSEGNVAGMLLRGITIRREGSQATITVTLSDRGEADKDAWQRGTREIAALLDDPAITTYYVKARSAAAVDICFAAPGVPGHGYRTFWVRPKPAVPAASLKLNPFVRALLPLGARLAQVPWVQRAAVRLLPDPARKPPFRIENEFFTVEASPDGTLIVTDRRSGAVYPGLNRFVDGGDCGDEYNYAPPEIDPFIEARLKGVRVERSAVLQSLLLSFELRIPPGLAPDRKQRAGKVVTLAITSRVTLAKGVARVDVQTGVDNLGRDHRLRVHFPAPFAAAEAWHDGHFEVVKRPVGLPPFDGTWIEQPRPEVPQRAFTDIVDGQLGLAVANRGLPEVEVLRQANGRAEIALTLLRCVGWLSRDDFPTRTGHAGPPSLATPGAQMPGPWSFEYAIIPHSAAGTLAAWQQAYAFGAPLRPVSTGLHAGTLPPIGSFIAVEPGEFVISAVKTAEDGRGWLVRGFNLGDAELAVRIRPWRPFKEVEQVNLAEESLSAQAPAEDGSVNFTARAHEILNVMFRD
jgi:mannosylglycerate hydrolase